MTRLGLALIPRVLTCACAVALIGSAACDDATGPCFQISGTFDSSTPDFVATVSQVTYESGRAPANVDIAQYAVWVTVSPNTSPNAGVLLSRSTPVFERALSGGVRASAACAIRVGDVVEVWRDVGWALGAVEAPPGDTLYFSTQILLRRR